MVTLIHLGLENADKIEGRGPEIPQAAFRDYRDLDLWVDEAPTWRTRTSVKLYGSWGEFLNDSKDQIRQNALKKLTPEEREALGL